MPAPRPEHIEIPFPRGGVHRGETFDRQPPNTTFLAKNVRGNDARGRSGGSKREGTIRAFDDQFLGLSNNRVTGMFPLTEAQGIPGGTGGTLSTIDDDFSGYSTGVPANIGNNYVGWMLDGTVTWASFGTDGPAGNASHQIVSGPPNYLRIPSYYAGHVINLFQNPGGIAVNGFTTNDVEIYLRTDSSQPSATAWGTDHCTGVGPFIRGAVNLTSFFSCRLKLRGINSVRFEILEHSPSGTTVRANSVDKALTGSATFVSDLRMRIYEDGDTIRAECDWPTNTIALTLSYASAGSLSGQRRGGIATMFDGTVPGSGAFRQVANFSAIRVIPASYTVFGQVDGSAAAPGGYSNYYLPDTFTSFHRSTAGVTTIAPAAPASSGVDPTYPAIDDSGNLLVGTAAGGAGGTDTANVFTLRAAPGEDDPIQGVDGVMRSAYVSIEGNDIIGAAFRISEDFTKFLWIEVRRQATNTASGNSQATGCTFIRELRVNLVNGATVTVLLNQASPTTINGGIWLRESDHLRWTDDGTTIRAYINGMEIFQYVPTGVSVLDGNKRVGIALGRATLAATIPSGNIGRIVSGEVPAATQISEIDSVILLVGDGVMGFGSLTDRSITTAFGTGVFQALPSGFAFNHKFYVVDGADEKVADPVANTVVDWSSVVTAGTLPADCRMAALWRLRAVLMRDPNNPTTVYLSRTLNPNDWDFGANPAATSAVALVVPDTITGGCAIENDYFLVGMATQLGMIEGDPGYGGKVQVLSNKTGLLGPRAYCFDEMGNFWFIGSSGLYLMPKGSLQPKKVGGKGVAFILDLVDSGTTLIELAYDAFKNYIRIFLTPADGITIGTHVVYDIDNNAFWPDDEYPLQFGPWSVCEIVGTADEDRRFLMGGNDGWIRRPSQAATADDYGTSSPVAIDSYVDFGPFRLQEGLVESLCEELQATVGTNTTGAITWYWFVGKSAQGVMQMEFGSEVASGTWGTNPDGSVLRGWQPPVGLRQRGAFHKLRIRQNSATLTWSLERIDAFLQARSGRR